MTSGIACGSDTSATAPSRDDDRTRPTASGGSPDVGQGRPQAPRRRARDCAERRRAGTQDAGVEALQELAGNVQRHARARFEVRADDPDRDAACTYLQPVLERPALDLALERRQRGQRQQLSPEPRDTGIVEDQPVERSLIELASGARNIGGVRGEHLGAALIQQVGGTAKRVADQSIGQAGSGEPGRESLALDAAQELIGRARRGLGAHGAAQSRRSVKSSVKLITLISIVMWDKA